MARTYQFQANENSHLLQWGDTAFHNRVWQIEESTHNSLILNLSYHHELDNRTIGFDSTLHFNLDDEDRLRIRMQAKCDCPFPLNLTRHEYFNLDGVGDIKNHHLQLNANAITHVNHEMIPTGSIADVSGTAYDFLHPKTIKSGLDGLGEPDFPLDGFDNNFILMEDNGQTSQAAILQSKDSMRRLLIETTQPCLQLYTGHGLNRETGFDSFSGLCLEPQAFPDASNQLSFPQ